jgi:hypothetical protein
MSTSDLAWTVPIAVADIPEAGGHYELSADAPARARVAQLAGLREVGELHGIFDLARQGDKVSVAGEVRARVGQTCVVSLDPIENDVVESIDLVFSPSAGETQIPPQQKSPSGRKEAFEPLVGGVIDLGAVAIEFLILGLDPYPRKPGAQLQLPHSETDPKSHPFAALNVLKKR